MAVWLCVVRYSLCDEMITRPEESYRLWCVVAYDLETSEMRRSRSAVSRKATGKYVYSAYYLRQAIIYALYFDKTYNYLKMARVYDRNI